MSSQPQVFYFSSETNNTHRFIQRVGCAHTRIPKDPKAPIPEADAPYVLVTPTFGAGDGTGQGAVPPAVIRFLNRSANRKFLLGVISSGNTNFGAGYGLAGDVIADKCQVPLLYKFELLGTPQDVEAVREGLKDLWKTQA